MKKIPKFNDKYHFQLYIRISVIVVATILVLSTILYVYSSNSILNTIYKANLSTFSQIRYTADNLNKQIKSNLIYFSRNDRISSLMYKKDISIVEVTQAFTQIEYILEQNPYIFSVYIYNSKTDTYYIHDGNSFKRQSAFYDTGISEILHNISNYSINEPIPRILPSGESVLTYILRDNYSLNVSVDNAIVINIKTKDFLAYMMGDVSDIEHDPLLILEYDGGLVATSHPKVDFTKYKTIIELLINSGKNSKYFTAKAENEKKFVSFVYLSSPKWILVRVTPYNKISSSMNLFKTNILLLTLIIIFMGLIVSYILSNKIYLPLNKIFNKINKIASTQHKTYDIQNLHENVDKIQKELNTLTEFKRTNQFHVKNEELKKFLFNSKTVKYLINDFMFLRETIGQNFVVCIYKLDHFNFENKSLNYTDLFFYKYALINIANELISNSFPCELIDSSFDDVTAIINISDSDNFLEELTTITKELQCAYQKNFNHSISAFISEPTDDLQNITQIYKETVDLSCYRLIFNTGCILTRFSIDTLSLQTNIITVDEIKPFINFINLAKDKEALDYLDELFYRLQGYNYSSLITSIYVIVTTIFNSFCGIGVTYSDFFVKIDKFETLDEVKEYFEDLIISIIKMKNTAPNSQTERNVNFIFDYIEENYHDINLCTKTLADAVNLSPRYLSRIFYSQTSLSVQAYINNFRIEKAKTFLLNTNYTIEEIIKKVGWLNSKHFYTLFKKNTSCTPGEFRNRKQTYVL